MDKTWSKEGLWTWVAIFTVVSPPECHRGKYGEEQRIYSILGIEYAWWRRQKASCAWRWWILLPMIFNVLTFDLMALLMLSMGEPRRVAWSGLTTQSSCAAVNIVSLVWESTLMILDFVKFKCSPRSSAAFLAVCKSYEYHSNVSSGLLCSMNMIIINMTSLQEVS